jgi:hypothetical protein
MASGSRRMPSGRDRVRLSASGLHPSHADRMQDGALSAAYYFLFRWAKENRIRLVDFCGTRPHLMDGVFRHKTLWGAEPKHDPWHHTEVVFYVDPEIRLPQVIHQQLVRQGEIYTTLGECLAGG